MNSDPNWSLERDAFLAASPPRRVPPVVLKKAVGHQPTNFLMGFGMIFLIMGLIFSFVFTPRHLLDEWRLKQGPSEVVMGRIVTVEKMRMKVNENPVWKHGFIFKDAAGNQRAGEGFLTGSKWKKGAKVKVRYLTADPSIAKLEKARMDEAPAFAMFVLLFPVVGAAVIFSTWWSRFSKQRLLRHGILGKAHISKMGPGWMTNGQKTYRVHLTREDDGKTIVRRVQDEAMNNFALRKQETGEAVAILYDPDHPKRFLFPETWDGQWGFSADAYLASHPEANRAGTMRPEIEAFLASPVPRRIPRIAAKKYSLGPFLWFATIFGGIFLSIGMTATIMMFPSRQLDVWKLERGPVRQVSGRIAEVKEGRMEINEEKLKEYAYVYRTEGGPERTGKAFALGKSWKEGDRVPVDYLESDPALALPVGARLSAGSLGDIWILLFPLIGATVLSVPWIIRHRRRHLLRSGERGKAKVVSMDKTSLMVNREPQYVIELLHSSGRSVTWKTYRTEEVSLLARKLRDGEDAVVLFNPLRPELIALPEAW